MKLQIFGRMWIIYDYLLGIMIKFYANRLGMAGLIFRRLFWFFLSPASLDGIRLKHSGPDLLRGCAHLAGDLTDLWRGGEALMKEPCRG